MHFKIRFFSVFLLTLFLAFGLSPVKTARAWGCKISGTVYGNTGNPIPNTNLFMFDQRTDGPLRFRATSDINGNYSSTTNCTPPSSQETYNIQAVPPVSSGFQTATVTNVLIPSDISLNFVLDPTIVGDDVPPNIDIVNKVSFFGEYEENGSFTDPDSTSWTATVDYGDGAGLQPLALSGQNFQLSHTYGPCNNYCYRTVTVNISDDGGAIGHAYIYVIYYSPYPNPPTSGIYISYIRSGQSYSGGSPYLYSSISAFIDASSSTSWSATVDYGDGTGVQPLELSGHNFTLNHTYSGVGDYYLVVKVTNNQGASSTGSTYVWLDTLPQVAPLSGGTVNLGTAYTETVTFTDPDINTYHIWVNYGDESYGEWRLGAWDPKTFTLNHTYNALGSYKVTAEVYDQKGGGVFTTSIVNVVAPNNPPIVNQPANASLNEGDTYTSNSSLTDSDSISWTATVDYGDGSGSQPLALTGTNFTLNHVYKDNGVYTVAVGVTDNQGATGTTSAIITVANIVPSAGAITASVNPIQLNTPTALFATFTDPGMLDTHTASWTWGDGNTTSGTVAETNGSGSISDSHIYATSGVYTVTLVLTDKDGGSGSASYQYVVVYNPIGGFLTGSGKYNSQAGWDNQNPSATGEVKFGISAQYLTGSNIPTGQAKVNFKIGDISFASTTFQWLVVTGNKATVQGSGTINGSGNYNFIMSGIDGSQNGGIILVRAKITDSSNNVVYDTQPGAADTADPTTQLISGNIKVH